MTYRYLISADGGRVAVGALKDRPFICNADFAFVDFDPNNILPRRITYGGRVTLLTGYDWNISILHCIDIAVLRDPQMTCRAVLFDMADAVVIKF